MAAVRENRRKILRGSFGSTLATFLARVLGLFRVMLEARVLGGGALASTWQLAFMMPNLFRRLLGEGALAQALIPLISHMEAQEGLPEVRRQLAVVFTMLTGILGAICVLVSGAALLLRAWITIDYVRDALLLMPCIMPYAVFICLVGVMSAVVNTRGVFFLASLNALLLNIVLLIVMYGWQNFAMRDPGGFLYVMCFSVLFSGVLQLLLLIWLLHRNNIMPVFRNAAWKHNPAVKELWTLALPGLIGGAASQVSFLVDRSLACWVGDYAVPALNYTERLVYLPIGMVAIALGSVLMANMSNAAARNDYNEMRDDLALGLRYVWFSCAPLAIFFVIGAEPVIRFFFMHGIFTQFHVEQTKLALQCYALGIPAFCATKVILPGFYARKQMSLPLKVSLFCMVLNLFLSIALLFRFRQGGIALATVVSSMFNNMILLWFLRKDGFTPNWRPVAGTALKSVTAGVLAALPLWKYDWIASLLEEWRIAWLPADTLPLCVCVALFLGIYFGVLLLMRAPEPRELIGSLLHRGSGK